MVEELARIAQERRLTDPYVAAIERTEHRLASLPSRGSSAARAAAHRAIGLAKLNSGKLWEAIGGFEKAIENLRGVKASAQLRLMVAARFWLGVSYLRVTEIDKCRRGRPDACVFPMRGTGSRNGLDNAIDAIEQLGFAMDLAQRGSPMHHAARWLLNVAYMTVGSYPDAVPESDRLDPASYSRDSDAIGRFTNIGARVGLAESELAGGIVIDDFDGDGWLDMFTSSMDPAAQLRFFRNEGGVYVERTDAAGIRGLTGGKNLVQADYDNDGDLDLLVLRGGGWGASGRHPNSLLRNDGGLRFTDVTFEAGLGEVHYPTQVGTWADYDNDGDLDLFIANESTGTLQYASQLFRNDGEGTFTDVAAGAGVLNLADGRGAAWGDFDGDRYPDLYVVNHQGPNRLYHNQRDGTFIDVAADLGVDGPPSGSVVWFWDVDNNGALDLLVNSYLPPAAGTPDIWHFAADIAGNPHPADVPRLYLADGAGGFVDAALAYGIARVMLPMGGSFGDLDNDGFLDFYLGTGYPGYDSVIPNFMFRNVGGERFSDVTVAGGFGHIVDSNAVAFADFDNDGDQDIFQQMGGQIPGDDFPNALYDNPGAGRSWISLQLRGTSSNRFALGARVRVDFVDAGSSRSVFRQVGNGSSYGGNPLRLHIGLGDAERVERIEVYWPTSDTTQVFEALEVNRRFRIIEAHPIPQELAPSIRR